ncbi:hypothetical protein HMH01_15490 [Halovulum dunhuangense]|uniref:Uncharacterized protein n=1 Tax=Halovulum dunhuangense TaxID=1505036 RepID=A0A849L6V0_9RHOB|nr:hypothetical protein [Halovulum dunhuangense]NNU81840.1 hypothetical protein [Halovulum dunhuangense]
MGRVPAYLAALLLAAPAFGQDAGSYRAAMDACIAQEDYACAFEAIMDAVGDAPRKPPVAVSASAGATVLGAQLFTVLDRAREQVPTAEWKAMTERAATYAVDAQPMDAFASGPFMMLYGEACLDAEEMLCLSQVAQSLRFLLESNQWYVAGETGPRERADALLAAFEEKTR